MSSMMDIIFILLIFVMMSISFSKSLKSIPIDIPKSISGNTVINDDIEIGLKDTGEIFLDNQPIDLNSLKNFSSQKKFENKKVKLSVSKKVTYESLIAILDILKNAKIQNLNLLTE